jgi:iron complex outermembrane recepter protein
VQHVPSNEQQIGQSMGVYTPNKAWGRVSTALVAFVLASGSAIAADENEIEEIVVTATYRDTALMDTPMAISSLTDEMIDVKGIVGIETLYESIPSMSFKTARGTYNNITIRGLGTTGGLSLVSVYVDEVPVTDQTEFAGDSQISGVLFDLQRVEVLKGPQGTLYGEGSVGGLIRYITKDADPNEYDLSIAANITDINESDDLGTRINAVANIPLIQDKLGLRVSAYYRDQPGILDIAAPRNEDDVDDQQDEGVRVKLNWYPTEKLEVALMANYMKSDFGGPGYGSFAYGSTEITGADFPNGGSDEHKQANLTVRYDLDWAELVSSTSYFEREAELALAASNTAVTFGYEGLVDFLRFVRPDLMLPTGPGLAGAGGDNAFLRRSDRFTQEIRLVSTGESNWSWTTGLYYSDSRGKKNKDGDQVLDGFLLVPNPGFEAVPDALLAFFGGSTEKVVDRDEQSVFGELNYRFNEQWDLTLGARFARLETDLLGTGEGLKDTFFSPKAILSWRPRDGMMFYGTVAQGFRQGVFNLDLLGHIETLRGLPTPIPGQDEWLAVNGSAFKTDGDEVMTYELGFKTEFLDNRVNLSTAIYYMEWKDILMAQTTAPPQLFGAEVLFQDNTGDAHSQGVELEITALLTDRITFTVGGDYNDEADLDSVDRSDAHIYITPITEGQRLFNSPKYSWNTSLAYHLPLKSGWALDARSDWYRVTDDFDAPGYHKVNARLSLSNANRSLQFALFAENIKDEEIIFNSNDILGIRFGQPRTIGLEVRYDMGGS